MGWMEVRQGQGLWTLVWTEGPSGSPEPGGIEEVVLYRQKWPRCTHTSLDLWTFVDPDGDDDRGLLWRDSPPVEAWSRGMGEMPWSEGASRKTPHVDDANWGISPFRKGSRQAGEECILLRALRCTEDEQPMAGDIWYKRTQWVRAPTHAVPDGNSRISPSLTFDTNSSRFPLQMRRLGEKHWMMIFVWSAMHYFRRPIISW